MFDREDVIFREVMERTIRVWLFGDERTEGYCAGLMSVQSWEQHQRSCGRIEGLRMVLAEMERVAQRMEGEPQARVDRSVN